MHLFNYTPALNIANPLQSSLIPRITQLCSLSGVSELDDLWSERNTSCPVKSLKLETGVGGQMRRVDGHNLHRSN